MFNSNQEEFRFESTSGAFVAGNSDSKIFYSKMQPEDLVEHSHSEIQIAMPLGANPVHAFWHTATGSNKLRTLAEGEISIVPADQPHAASWKQEIPFFSVFFNPQRTFEILAAEVTGQPLELIEQYGIRDGLVQNLIQSLLSFYHQQYPITEFYFDAFNTILTHHLLANYSIAPPKISFTKSRKPPLFVLRSLEFIEDNIQEKLTVAFIARSVNVSEFHFARVFRVATGRSVHQFIIERRIERAKILLLQAELSMTEISSNLGFANASHFTSLFRRYTQTTPTDFSRKSSGGFS